MYCMKISAALLAVPLCLVALACENQSPTDTQQPEALANPRPPSFSMILPNGCDVTAGVIQKGQKVIGTDGPDAINCMGYNKPGSKGVTIRAGDGNDNVFGSSLADNIDGGKGCDHVHGGDGNDVVTGGQGNDTFMALAGCTVAAGAGLPSRAGGVFGDDGDDEVGGGMGDDILWGGPGTGDVCGGGKGTDIFVITCEVCGDPDQAGIPPCP